MNKYTLANKLHYIFSILMLFAIVLILSGAFYFQFIQHELPCPLCLLQRVAYLGICFGIILNLRIGFSMRHEALSMLMIILLMIVSARQTLLDIYPRPGHEYIGSSVFGLHMPVWSIVFAVIFLLMYVLRFLILGYDLQKAQISHFPIIKNLSRFAMLIILLICGLNLISVFLQCGFSECHTDAYQLLTGSI